MQKIERVKLKSGLEVNFLIDKNFTTSSIQMCFKIGWRNDTESERGLAHLFEHLVGKRTKKYPGKSEFAIKLDEEGIVSNAWTGPDSTVYYQNQTHKQALTSLEILFEAIYNSVFLLEDLEKEKSVVMNESKRYLDNDDSLLWRLLMLNLYSGTTMEKYFFGDEKTMKNITLEHFSDFYEIYKNPKNSILFIGTNDVKNKVKFLKFLNSFYDKKENKSLFSNKKILKFSDKVKEANLIKFCKISKPDREQANLRLVYKTDKLTERESIVGGVVVSMLTGGLTGRLMKVLRDEMGLVYSIGMTAGDYAQGVHYFGFSTTCDKEKTSLLIETLKKEVSNFSIDVRVKDIKQVIPTKEYQVQKPVFVHSDVESLMDCVIYNTKYLQTEEYLKILKSVSVNDVKKFLTKVFAEENSSVSILE